MDVGVEEEAIPPAAVTRPYQLINQKVDLEVDFGQRINGTTHLTIFPDNPEVRIIRVHARQCRIHDVMINGLRATVKEFHDPCDTLTLHTQAGVHQHHLLSDKLEGSLAVPPVEELVIALPDKLKIEFNPEFVTQQAGTVKAAKLDSTTTNDAQAAEGLADTQISRYTRLDVSIKFSSIHTRDALHFAIGGAGAGRWPHVYTRGGFQPGRASCIFPCIDDVRVRCTWEFSIKAPKTVGDALRQIEGLASDEERKNLSATYEAREMVFVCPGEIVDDAVDKNNTRQRTVSFIISQNVAAEQIGFAIGPFERTDLNVFREAEEAEMLQDKAVSMSAYCLPGRQEEIENTCLPMTRAMDFIVKNYTFYPYNTFAFCFVDDHDQRPEPFAGISMCSTRLLYPENVIDNTKDTTRTLVNSIASQWMGVQILPEKPVDAWVTIGSSLYVTEHFMRELCGRNEYRYHMKHQSDQIVQLDYNRPSIYDIGALLHVDSAEYEFLARKAPIVLYILDRRIAKTTGAPKVASAIAKIMSRARNEDLKDNLVSTEAFMERVEKLWYNTKSDDFVNQWIKGAGCPNFTATQRFNKKKMVIEMTIRQVQGTQLTESELSPSTFMRDVREDLHSVYAGAIQNVFTGPMTIRIHEADGTPYEHIVEIKEAVTYVEVPYNTKYKRLKRSKRQKARAVKTAAEAGEEENDALVYCLGDTLQTEEEILKWHLTEWSPEDEDRMNAESFEWIRLDADFEWISAIRLAMPGYMFASQLQQDRDVAAQLVSVQHIENYAASPLISTILLRTMMDARYFHAIRTASAHALVKHATYDNDCNMIGLFHLKMAYEELYCTTEGDSVITLPNDFSDQLSYHLQCALIEAISKVRDAKGYTPREVKEFLLDKLRFNDNSINSYSDAHYISILMRSLASCLIARPPKPATNFTQPDLEVDFDMDNEVSMRLEAEYHELLQLELQCLAEIDRYRRMDEWTSSHQNLYARTALECQALLARSNIGTFSPIHYLQYTRPGNYDMLRATAYDLLATSNLFANAGTTILRYIIHCLVADPSPYIRHRLRSAFGRALARKAIGEHKVDTSATAEGSGVNPASTTTGLVIEEISLEDKAKDTLRRQSIEAALEALKKDLQPHEPLQQFLYAALTHPDASFEDVRFLLEFCGMLYDTKNTAVVVLRKPRYWRLEVEGKGKLKFTQTNKVRERKLSLWRPKAQNQNQTQPKTVISLSRANSIQQGQGQAPGKSLKLKFGRRDSGLPLAMISPGGSLGQTSPTPPPLSAQSVGGGTQAVGQGRVSETPKPELKLKLKLKPPGSGSPGS